MNGVYGKPPIYITDAKPPMFTAPLLVHMFKVSELVFIVLVFVVPADKVFATTSPKVFNSTAFDTPFDTLTLFINEVYGPAKPVPVD